MWNFIKQPSKSINKHEYKNKVNLAYTDCPGYAGSILGPTRSCVPAVSLSLAVAIAVPQRCGENTLYIVLLNSLHQQEAWRRKSLEMPVEGIAEDEDMDTY
jgi:hypothetical protein